MLWPVATGWSVLPPCRPRAIACCLPRLAGASGTGYRRGAYGAQGRAVAVGWMKRLKACLRGVAMRRAGLGPRAVTVGWAGPAARRCRRVASRPQQCCCATRVCGIRASPPPARSRARRAIRGPCGAARRGALLPPVGAEARRHTRIRAGGSVKRTSPLARSGTYPQRFLHRTLGRKVGWSFPECAHLAQHRITSQRRRGSLRARSSCQVVAHHRNDGGAPARARYPATSGSRHRYGGGADPGERGPRLPSRGTLEGARGNRWPPRGSEARHRRGAHSSRSSSATRAYESTRATEGACQTPAGQRPQSVDFKLRSRLGDSA